jgi:hypothetical protein
LYPGRRIFPESWRVSAIISGLNQWNDFTWTEGNVNYGPLSTATIDLTWTSTNPNAPVTWSFENLGDNALALAATSFNLNGNGCGAVSGGTIELNNIKGW